MDLRPGLSVGLAAWRSLALAATAVAVHALGAATPAQAYCAYVANSESNFISVIDTATNTESTTIEEQCSAGRCDPDSVAVTPDGRFLYVANVGSNQAPFGNTVAVIQTATNTVAAMIIVGDRPERVAITPNGAFAYVTNTRSGTVSVIDTSKALADPPHAVIDSIPVGSTPFGVFITPDGGLVFVSTCGSPCDGSALSTAVIDTSTNTIRSTTPGGIVGTITPDGQFAYMANSFTDIVTVTDIAKVLTDPAHAMVDTIPVGRVPIDVAITPEDFGYVANCGEHCLSSDPSSVSTVMVIDIATNTVASTITLPPTSAPASVGITPDGAFAYVTNAGADTVAALDTGKALTDPEHAVIATIPVGPRPWAVAIASLPMCIGGHPTCVGDCGVDRQVTVDELLAMVNIALGNAEVSACQAGDRDGGGQITIDEILAAVNNALNGC